MSILPPPTTSTTTVKTDADIYTILDSGTTQDIPDSCAICLNSLFAFRTVISPVDYQQAGVSTQDDFEKATTSGPGIAVVDNQQTSGSTEDDSGMETTSGPGIAPTDNQHVIQDDSSDDSLLIGSVETTSYEVVDNQQTSVSTADDSGMETTSGPEIAPTDNQHVIQGDSGTGIAVVSTQDDSGIATTSGPGIAPANNYLAKLKNCGHIFHTHCIEQSKMQQANGLQWYLQCPVCKKINGVKIGTQPIGGTMNHKIINYSLAGYDRETTIEITYNFKDGKQGPEHPNPGKKYTAYHFPRHAYIPNTTKGGQLLKLLEEAFKRRLTFTVGQSATTGAEDMVTWNDIPHKTDRTPNAKYGYPDPKYLDRVIEKLKEHGIYDEDDNNAKADDKEKGKDESDKDKNKGKDTSIGYNLRRLS